MAESTLSMSYADWKAERRKGIGGSDAAAVLGLSRWKSAARVYMEKIGAVESGEAGEAAYWGTILEPIVAKEFEHRTGKKVRRVNRIMIHPERPYMIANIDRRVAGEDAILECKTTSAWNSKEWAEGVPKEYIVQCMHYMAVTGTKKTYLAVLLGGNKFEWQELYRDDEFIDMMIKTETEFWQCVQNRTPPVNQPAGSKDYSDLLSALYPTSEPTEIELPPTATPFARELVELKKQLKLSEERKDYLETSIKEYMRENESAKSGSYKISWRSITTSRFDLKKFETEYYDLCQQYMKETSVRRFTIKEEE